ncbi:MAG: ATP-binding protein [Burkholderiaceae bacterium]
MMVPDESVWARLSPRLTACLELAGCLGDDVRALVLVPGTKRLFTVAGESGWPATIEEPPAGLSALLGTRRAVQWADGDDSPIGASQLRAHWPTMRRLAAEPLLVGDRTVGVLCIADENLAPWSGHMLQGLARLAVVCANAVADHCDLAEAVGHQARIEHQAPGFFFEMTEAPDGCLRLPYLSARAQALLGVAAPVQARDANALFGRIPAEQQALIRQNLRDAVINGQSVRGVFRLDLSPGSPTWLRGEARALRQRDGTLVATGYLEEVTELVALTRRAERAQADMISKSEFIAQLSHEVRTPLAGILGFAQLMRMDQRHPLRGEQRARLNQIELASHRLLELVSGVLELARIEDGRHRVAVTPVDAVSLLRATLDMLQPLADAYGARLQLTLPDAPLMVLAEDRALNQVMTNLLSNAIKYNRRGGRVQVTLHGDENQCRLSVTDEGQGMTAEQMKHLFTPFRRFGQAAQSVEGTGLGLTISRRLVQMMGGRISVQSTPGEGSRFEVSLPGTTRVARPRAVGGRPVPAAWHVPGPPADEASRNAIARPATILCVEDDRLNGLLMAAVFAQCPGWTMHLARSLQEAREQFDRCRPDLVITDINLPDGSGQALLALAQAVGDRPAVPCIAVSADVSEAQVGAARIAGFVDFWAKPVDLQRLVENTGRWLAATRSDGAAPG